MEPPESLEHFRILRTEGGGLWELGRGSMGVTYKALDTRLEIPVAIKVINPEITRQADVVRRFLREAQAAAKLRHPNIASVYHFGEMEGLAFYVMEFCDGPTVQNLVEGHGALSVRESLTLTLQIARALTLAEQHKILHRDLKPSNLILTSIPDQVYALKIIDFGLACGYGNDAPSGMATQNSAFTGTVWFASPEQLLERQLDIRSDFYALGACLWFMLSGRAVFEGSVAEVMAATLRETPSFSRLPKVPVEVRDLLESLLAKEPSRRPSSALSLCSVIEDCLNGPNRSTEVRRPERSVDREQTGVVEGVSGEAGKVPEEDISERFQIRREIDRHPCWSAYSAFETDGLREVCIHVLKPSISAVPSVVRELAARLRRIHDQPHESLCAVLAYGTTSKGFTIVTAPMCQITALRLLRARGAVKPSEAVRLLMPAAKALDHLEDRFSEGAAIGLASIGISFSGDFDEKIVLRCPVSEWPSFTVAVNVLGLDALLEGGDTGTVASMATQMVGGVAFDSGSPGLGAARLAAMFYELIGGTPSLRQGFAPLPRLTEEANLLFREAENGRFPSATLWISKLETMLGVEIPSAAATEVRVVPGALPRRTGKPVVVGLVLLPVCLSLGWLFSTLVRNRHERDPRAYEKSISLLEDILRRRFAMNATIDEIETIQRPRLSEAQRNVQASPGQGWEETAGLLAQAIQRRERSIEADRASVMECQTSLIDSWEAYPESYEDALRGISESSGGDQNPEMVRLARIFLRRFEDLHKTHDRKSGNSEFFDSICPATTGSK